MKIEKLTENKIRVIVNQDELGVSLSNVPNMMSKAIEAQGIFLDILKRAEKEVDFHTDGCKLLIEAFSSLDDVCVFTITKFLQENDIKKKKLAVKRRSFKVANSKYAICQFESFDSFCEFCNAIKCVHKINTNSLAKNIALYLWKDSYYLVLRSVNTSYEFMNLFYSTLSEFGKLVSCSDSFEYKLLEYGKVLIKKNAINVGIDFFVD